MFAIHQRLDPGSLMIVALTLAVFVAALFNKGFAHDLVVEAGVLLASLKLVIMSVKNVATAAPWRGELGELRAVLQCTEQAQPASGAPPAASRPR